MGPRILLIDDDQAIGRTLVKLLRLNGYETGYYATGGEGVAAFEKEPGAYDMAIVDLRLPDIDGTEVVKRLKGLSPELPCVIFTAFGTIEKAVDAMNCGAFDFIRKPFPREKLLLTIERGLEHTKLTRENRQLKERLDERKANLARTSSPRFKKVIGLARTVAPTEATVLLCGETGTGKERMAQYIHEVGTGGARPFLTVNCAALAETLLESQLFGHKKGSFTGADKDQAGLFEKASEGTLFLDEIGDISLALQVKLLRVLQEKEYLPVGSTTPKRTGTRVIAATNRNLAEMVACGEFRQDLFYRLNMFVIELPPLRARMEDLDALVTGFIGEANGRMGKSITGLEPEALQLLAAHDWPGNIRELKNVVERAAILCTGNVITRSLIALPAPPAAAQGRPGAIPWPAEPMNLEELEREYISHLLEVNRNRKAITATQLGVSRSTLNRKIERYHIAAGDSDE